MTNVAFEDLFRSLARKSTMLDGDTEKVSADQNVNLQLRLVALAMHAAPLCNDFTFPWKQTWLSRNVYHALPGHRLSL